MGHQTACTSAVSDGEQNRRFTSKCEIKHRFNKRAFFIVIYVICYNVALKFSEGNYSASCCCLMCKRVGSWSTLHASVQRLPQFDECTCGRGLWLDFERWKYYR